MGHVELGDCRLWLVAVAALAELHLLAPFSIYEFIDGLALRSEAESIWKWVC